MTVLFLELLLAEVQIKAKTLYTKPYIKSYNLNCVTCMKVCHYNNSLFFNKIECYWNMCTCNFCRQQQFSVTYSNDIRSMISLRHQGFQYQDVKACYKSPMFFILKNNLNWISVKAGFRVRIQSKKRSNNFLYNIITLSSRMLNALLFVCEKKLKETHGLKISKSCYTNCLWNSNYV